jgi:hypothetical protein
MAKVNRGKPIVAQKSASKISSYEEIQAKLESLKEEHLSQLQGQRLALYKRLQDATVAALSLEADPEFESRFLKKMHADDVLRAALIFIFVAKSEAEKKEASKRARALRYLIDEMDISSRDIATAIPKHGGVEKLARLAAKSAEDQDEEDQDKPEEDADENDEVEKGLGSLIKVSLSPKLNKKLNRFDDKTRIKIIGHVRVSSDDSPTIEVEKIAKLKIKTAPDAETAEGDWE